MIMNNTRLEIQGHQRHHHDDLPGNLAGAAPGGDRLPPRI